MPKPDVSAWKSPDLVEKYLTGIRSALPLAKEQIEVLLRLVRAGNGPVTRFLDLGCGDGILAAAILSEYPEAHGVLLDFSDPMIAAARSSFAGTGFDLDYVTFDYGDPGWTGALPVSDRRFDLIVSGLSIHHQPDERKRGIYKEIFDLLEPGGVFLHLEHVAPAAPWVETVWLDWFTDNIYAQRGGEVADMTREQVRQVFIERPDRVENILALVEDQCRWLREIEFEDVDCYLKVLEAAIFGGRRPARRP